MKEKILAALLAGWNTSKTAIIAAIKLFIVAALVSLGISEGIVQTVLNTIGGFIGL